MYCLMHVRPSREIHVLIALIPISTEKTLFIHVFPHCSLFHTSSLHRLFSVSPFFNISNVVYRSVALFLPWPVFMSIFALCLSVISKQKKRSGRWNGKRGEIESMGRGWNRGNQLFMRKWWRWVRGFEKRVKSMTVSWTRKENPRERICQI